MSCQQRWPKTEMYMVRWMPKTQLLMKKHRITFRNKVRALIVIRQFCPFRSKFSVSSQQFPNLLKLSVFVFWESKSNFLVPPLNAPESTETLRLSARVHQAFWSPNSRNTVEHYGWWILLQTSKSKMFVLLSIMGE